MKMKICIFTKTKAYIIYNQSNNKKTFLCFIKNEFCVCMHINMRVTVTMMPACAWHFQSLLIKREIFINIKHIMSLILGYIKFHGCNFDAT